MNPHSRYAEDVFLDSILDEQDEDVYNLTLNSPIRTNGTSPFPRKSFAVSNQIEQQILQKRNTDIDENCYQHKIDNDIKGTSKQKNDFLLGTLAPALISDDVESYAMDDESMLGAKLLLDFLASHKNQIENSPELLMEFENLTRKQLSRFPNNASKLYSVLSAAGWNENGYQLSLFRSLDEEGLSLALGTFYLNHAAEKRSAFHSLSKKNLMNFASEDDTVKSFCPSILLSILEKNFAGKSMQACSTPFTAACMIADISGFTKLSSTFSSKGSAGLDELHQHTNGFLGHLVNIVYQHGGDVISFAGDALVCIFRVIDESTISSALSSKRALKCALELKDHYTETLTAHIAISYGKMSFSTLGGHKDEWTYLLNGHCISELSSCLDDAGSREIVITETFYVAVMSQLDDDERLMAYPNRNKNRLVKKLKSLASDKEVVPRLSQFSSTEPLLKLARLFVPPPAMDAIEVGTFSSLAELREVTTLFLKLDTYSPVLHEDPVTLQPLYLILQEKLHCEGGFMRQFLLDDKGCVFIGMWGVPSLAYTNNCTRALLCAAAIVEGVQKIGHHVSIGITTGSVFCGNIGSEMRRDFVGIGATVNLAARFMSKAEGCILVDEITYNRIPDSKKSTLTRSYGMHLKGVTGKIYPYVFVGSVETLLSNPGEDENRNKDLVMRKPLVDAFSILLECLTNYNVLIGDCSKPVRLPTHNGGDQINKDDNQRPHITLFSLFREASMAQVVKDHSRRSVNRRNSDSDIKSLINCVIVEGQPGMGRSTAAKYFKEITKKKNLRSISVTPRLGDEIVQLSIIRKLFAGLVDENVISDEVNQRRRLRELIFSAIPEYETKTSQTVDTVIKELQAALGLASQGNYAKAGLANNITLLNILVKTLRYLISNEPTVVFIENAHHGDTLSWACLRDIVKANLRVAMVITFQSNFNTLSSQKIASVPTSAAIFRRSSANIEETMGMVEIVSEMVCNPRCIIVKLLSLNKDEVGEILIERLAKKTAITDELVSLVLEASSGNPYWCEAIAQYIEERGDKDFVAAMQSNANTDASNALSVLVISKLGLLKPEEQLIIKFASAIGEEFSLVILEAIIPERFRSNLRVYMHNLIAFGFLKTRGDLYTVEVLSFQNTRIRNIIYEMLPMREAAKTHVDIARYIENREYDLKPFYTMLSHHYGKSKTKQHKAYKYSVKAADQFIFGGAYAEGLVYLRRSFEIITKKDITGDLRDFPDLTEKEFMILFEVINSALDDIAGKSLGKNIRTFMYRNFHRRIPNDPILQSYLDLEGDVERGKKEYLEDLKRLNSSSKKKRMDGLSNKSNPKDALLVWEASYTNSKLKQKKIKQKPKPGSDNCVVS